MANPAPTINQINAFNATQGTTIDFNIIGGTELVRSNRIYIYDLSDNSLICTHLYTSTESVHELPANTDSSIVYESGKSSADFVNGAQYYAQIQTYTDTAGTQGGSGVSVAKMFWCLVNPTLTITTIPSTISTTSYNVSATYTDTSASVVSNIIQQYQFNLYSATGSLLQSSGVVVGSGERQGTSANYRISYNLTGLSVGSSYYVVVNVTTTQGMSVSAQSSTFTVSIDTPTLGEATVVNNACDGYISVTSNLSSEYGGSASGEIASFVTDSVNNISSLKVSLDPIQDLNGYDAPWVGGVGKNKLQQSWTSPLTNNGVTFTRNSDGSVTATGATSDSADAQCSITFSLPVGNYYFTGCADGGSDAGRNSWNVYMWNQTARARIKQWDGSTNTDTCINNTQFYEMQIPNTTDSFRYTLRVMKGTTLPTNGITFYPMICLATETDPTYAPYENICPIYGYGDGAGKNKLPYPYYNSSGTSNGITRTVNSDGSVTFNGTATANSWFNFCLETSQIDWSAGSYTANVNGGESNPLISGVSVTVNVRVGTDNKYGVTLTNSVQSASFTPQENGYLRCYVQINSGVTVNNMIIKPMIRFASEQDATYEPYSIRSNVEVTRTGRNLISASFGEYVPLYLPKDTALIASAKSTGIPQINYYDSNQTRIDYWSCQYDAVDGRMASRAFTLLDDAYYFRFTGTSSTEYQLEFGDTATAYEPFGNKYTTVLGQTVYGGTLDVISGVLTVDRAYIGGSSWMQYNSSNGYKAYRINNCPSGLFNSIPQLSPMSNMINTFGVFSSSSMDRNIIQPPRISETTAYMALLDTLDASSVYLSYLIKTPQTYQLTPQQINTLLGQNNVWSEQGDVELSYHIPITNLLVKRQDVGDVSGDWLTLYSQPITQASDMDFTFIDFLNQYGKTYKYALVPLLTQTQSGVEVEVEGGYTVSDEVQSIFDGVFIADQTNVERVKAGVGYGNIDMNQNVGTIVPIGSKYPIVVTNSQNQYHNGSVRGKIVPNDFYSNGNLSRIDMVNKRDELEQFLTNKRAKIIKDWNGKIWLVMILSNVSCTFDDNYGMGMVEFSADWVEIGDPTTQQDLYNAGLINVGGV